MVADVLTEVVMDKSYNRKKLMAEYFSGCFFYQCIFLNLSVPTHFPTKHTGVVHYVVSTLVHSKIKSTVIFIILTTYQCSCIDYLYVSMLLNTINTPVRLVTSCTP